MDFREYVVDVGMLPDVPEDLSVVDGDDAAIDEVIAIPGCRIIDVRTDEACNLLRCPAGKLARNYSAEDRITVGTKGVSMLGREPSHDRRIMARFRPPGSPPGRFG